MTETLMQRCSVKKINWKNLYLDPFNPRLYTKLGNKILDVSYEYIGNAQEEIYNGIIADKSRIRKLELSMINNGYIAAEHLIVLEIFDKKGHYVVKEGNRRLSAIRMILKNDDKKKSIRQEIIDTLEKLPCYVLPDDVTEIEILEILSARHIVGTVHWGTSERNIAIAEIYQRLLQDEEQGVRDSESTILTQLAKKAGLNSPQAAANHLLAVYLQNEVISNGVQQLAKLEPRSKSKYMSQEILEQLQLDMFSEAVRNSHFRSWIDLDPNRDNYLKSKINDKENFSKYLENILRNVITSGKNHQRAYIKLMTNPDANDKKYSERIDEYLRKDIEPKYIIERVYSEYISAKPDKTVSTIEDFSYFLEVLDSEKIKSDDVLKEQLSKLLKLLKGKLEVD